MLKTTGLKFFDAMWREHQLPDVTLAPGQAALVRSCPDLARDALIDVLGGYIRPSGGSLEIAGRNIADLTLIALASFRDRHIATVTPTLSPTNLNVKDALLLQLYLADLPTQIQVCERLIEEVGLASVADAPVLSLGPYQRYCFGIAQARLKNPKLIVAANPSEGLQRHETHWVMGELLKAAVGSSAALVVVSDDDVALEVLTEAKVIDLA